LALSTTKGVLSGYPFMAEATLLITSYSPLVELKDLQGYAM
jgi:hypothetical protein